MEYGRNRRARNQLLVFIAAVILVAARGDNAEWAISEEAGSMISRLEVSRDPYFQARAEDIRDLAGKILQALTGSPKIALGAMIEVPAAAFAAGDILKEADFVSVGTNDLLQYFLAADRDNPELVEYGETPGPGFLSLMRLIIGQAAEQGRQNDVAICGEMAANTSVLPALIRLGYRSFSVSPILAPAVRAAAARMDLRFPAPY